MKPVMPGVSTLEEEWDEVRKSVAIDDLREMVYEAIALIGQNHANEYWKPVTDIESILREHLSHTKGDSGIPNTHHRYSDPVSHIINNSQEVLGLSLYGLVERILNDPGDRSPPYYDIRDTSVEALYNWASFYHNGEELEAIHLAILRSGNEVLRGAWAQVLSAAFHIASLVKKKGIKMRQGPPTAKEKKQWKMLLKKSKYV